MAAGGRATAVVLVLMFATATWAGAAVSGSADDASSGTDAGNAPANALALASEGTYRGAAGTGDVDWYSTGATGSPTCAVLDVATTSPRRAVLALVSAGGETRYVSTTVGSGSDRIVISAPDAVRAFVSLGAASPVDYAFTLDLVATGGDAASDFGVPTWKVDPCVAGTLSGSFALDRYLIDAAAGERVDISMASVDPTSTVTLRDPAGELVAVLGSGQAMTFSFPTSGTYSLEVASTSAAAYVLGSVLGDPGPQPCRPNCRSFADA